MHIRRIAPEIWAAMTTSYQKPVNNIAHLFFCLIFVTFIHVAYTCITKILDDFKNRLGPIIFASVMTPF